MSAAQAPRSLRRWLQSTSNRTFVVWPLALLALQALLFSGVAWAVLVAHALWFDRRVRSDEAALLALFGAPYREYVARVKRLIPGVY